MHSFLKYLVVDLTREKHGHTVSEHDTQFAATEAARTYRAAHPTHDVAVAVKNVQES